MFPVSGLLSELEHVCQSRHPRIFQLSVHPSVVLVLPDRALLVHHDLERIRDRGHDVRMRAVREYVPDSLLQVLVPIGTIISPRPLVGENALTPTR